MKMTTVNKTISDNGYYRKLLSIYGVNLMYYSLHNIAKMLRYPCIYLLKRTACAPIQRYTKQGKLVRRCRTNPTDGSTT